MNPEVKTEWVRALRSGEYEQGFSALRTNDEFCCLGVLCDLAVKHGVIPQPSIISFSKENYCYGEEQNASFLPNEVVKWAGLPDANPKIYSDEFAGEALSSFNDAEDTFDQIADLIEEQL